MKKLLILTIIMAVAAISLAAEKTYYSYPTAIRLRESARFLVYDNLSGSRNITAAAIKESVNTEPVLKGRYGNYSSVIYKRYSSNDQALISFGRYSATRSNRTYMYFIGNKLVITPKAP